jgi:hypothetical protein
MFACRARRGRTLSALVSLLSRFSGLSRAATVARVTGLACISGLARRALLSRLPRLFLWSCRTRHRRGCRSLVTPRDKQRQQSRAAK